MEYSRFVSVLQSYRRFSGALKKILPKVLGGSTKGKLLSSAILQVRDVFHQMDAPPHGDGNGLLTLQELREGLHRLGVDIPAGEVQELFDAMDVESANLVDCRDFVAALCMQHEQGAAAGFAATSGRGGSATRSKASMDGLRMRAVKRLLEAWDPESKLFGKVRCTPPRY